MNRIPVISLASVGALLLAVNAERADVRIAATIAVLTLFALAVWILLPLARNPRRSGRYLARVYAVEYGTPNQIWSAHYRTYLGALLGARRVALRQDYLGDVYSEFVIKTSVTDTKRAFRSQGMAGAVK